ncbi:MAG: phosphate/phosphite/phosphonate ABC transporter substrate-binding protein [Pseudomonadota bacterium]
MKYATKFVLLLAVLMLAMPLQAQLLLTAAPLFDRQASEDLYQPFANALGEVVDQEVIYEHPDDWLQYAKLMRTGRYDLIFDQAHFAAWRMLPQNLFHEAVARLPGENRYVVVAPSDSPALGLADLLSRQICAQPSPSLSTMVVLSQFTNPVRQPVMVESQGRFADVFEKFKGGECDAAVLSQYFYESEVVNSNDQQEIKLLWTSNPIPNLVLTITKKHPASLRQELEKALTDEMSPKGSDEIFTTFAPQEEKRYIPVKTGELESLENMLQGVLWGW